MTTPADTTTASAPVTEVQEVSMQERLNAATPEEYKNWEKTGDIPPVKPKAEAPPKPADSAPAPSSETQDSQAKPDAPPPSTSDIAAASPAAPTQKTETRSEKRWRELSEKFGNLQREHEELKRQAVKPAADVSDKPISQPAADGKTEVKASDAEPELGGTNPKTGKPYQTIAEWQKDHTAWLRAQVLAEVDGKFTKSDEQRKQAEQERILNQGFAAKLEPGKAKYPDFDSVAMNPDLYIPRGSAADTFLRTSEHAAEVLYYLGQHPEILEGFYREPSGQDRKKGAYENTIHPQLQFLELAKIEARLTATPVTVPTPKPSAQVIPPLPPPPTVLSAKGSAAGDAVEEALSKKSFADYEKAANASERKSRRA